MPIPPNADIIITQACFDGCSGHDDDAMVATVESLGKLLKWVLITLLMWMGLMGMSAQIHSHCKLLFCHLPRGLAMRRF